MQIGIMPGHSSEGCVGVVRARYFDHEAVGQLTALGLRQRLPSVSANPIVGHHSVDDCASSRQTIDLRHCRDGEIEVRLRNSGAPPKRGDQTDRPLIAGQTAPSGEWAMPVPSSPVAKEPRLKDEGATDAGIHVAKSPEMWDGAMKEALAVGAAA